MPKKKSIKTAVKDFQVEANKIEKFAANARMALGREYLPWAYEYAIIKLYREFEHLMLQGLVGAINNDTKALSNTVGITFPRHLTDDVCEYLISGAGYFDFKGRDGLIKQLRRFIPETHYLLGLIKKEDYKDRLEKLCALRNFAAHNSFQSKRTALKAVNLNNLGSAGSWLMRQDRFKLIVNNLNKLAHELHDAAPY